MSKGGKGKQGKGSSANSELLQTETVLQALIIADSFDQKFTPITLEAPRVCIS
jgi:hypothetical protein